MSAGLDSLSATEFTNALGARFSMDLAPTILFDHPTLESLAGFISGTLTSNEAARPTIYDEINEMGHANAAKTLWTMYSELDGIKIKKPMPTAYKLIRPTAILFMFPFSGS